MTTTVPDSKSATIPQPIVRALSLDTTVLHAAAATVELDAGLLRIDGIAVCPTCLENRDSQWCRCPKLTLVPPLPCRYCGEAGCTVSVHTPAQILAHSRRAMNHRRFTRRRRFAVSTPRFASGGAG